MNNHMTEKKWDVYVYGDINTDLIIPNVKKFPESGQEDEVDVMETFVGGGAALFALGIGKLGLYPVFQGTIGDDCYGKMILEELEKNNVDTCLLEVSKEQKTGISISFTNEHDRAFLTMRGTNALIDVSKVNIEKVKKACHIHVTGYAGSVNHDAYLNFLQQVKARTEATVSFDLGWDPAEEWKKEIYDLFPYIDVLFMNETEAIHYGRKETASEAGWDFAKYCPVVALKLGAKGSIAFANGKMYQKNRYQVTAVDTTGAGDSFNAGFIYGYLSGRTMEECLACGNGCGALSVTAFGGNTGFPVEEELWDFICSNDSIEYVETNKRERLLMDVSSYIEKNYRDGELEELAKRLHYDTSWLSKEIKKCTGYSYTALVQNERMKQAAYLLSATNMKVIEVALTVGYENISYFHKIFQTKFGMTPRKYRLENKK